MEKAQEIERRIELKRQLIRLTEKEIKALELILEREKIGSPN